MIRAIAPLARKSEIIILTKKDVFIRPPSIKFYFILLSYSTRAYRLNRFAKRFDPTAQRFPGGDKRLD
jgi:hypothetical protein